MRQTVNTAIASGTGPDIIFYDAGPGYAGVLADAGLLLPLDDYAAQYGWKERVAPPALEATTIDGTLYGMPLQVDLIGMYYNKTLLDKEGMTVPRRSTTCHLLRQAKEKGYIPIAFADNPGWEAFHQFSMTTNQMIGPEAMRELLIDNQGSWNTPEIITAIEAYFVTLRDAGCFPDDANAITYDDGNSLFFSGQALAAHDRQLAGRRHRRQHAGYGSRVRAVPGDRRRQGPRLGLRRRLGLVHSNEQRSIRMTRPRSSTMLFSPETVDKWVGEAASSSRSRSI